MLGILIDQDTNVEGVFVDFFGKKAFTPVGPVALALKTNASVVPLAIQLMDDFKHRVLIKKPIKLTRTGDKKKDLVINTQKLSDFLEETIRLRPSQWVWMHEHKNGKAVVYTEPTLRLLFMVLMRQVMKSMSYVPIMILSLIVQGQMMMAQELLR